MSSGFAGDRYYPQAATLASDAAAPVQARPFISVVTGAVVGGKVRATFGPPRSGVAWSVTRCVVQNNVSGRAFAYVGEERPENVIDGTNSGTFDVKDQGQPWYVPEGQALLIVWQGSTGGATATARIEYLEI